MIFLSFQGDSLTEVGAVQIAMPAASRAALRTTEDDGDAVSGRQSRSDRMLTLRSKR